MRLDHELAKELVQELGLSLVQELAKDVDCHEHKYMFHPHPLVFAWHKNCLGSTQFS